MEFFRTPTVVVIQELIRGNVDDEGVSAERMIWRVKSQPALIVFNGGDELLALQTCFLAYATEKGIARRERQADLRAGISREKILNRRPGTRWSWSEFDGANTGDQRICPTQVAATIKGVNSKVGSKNSADQHAGGQYKQ